MINYRYKAKDVNGKTVIDTISAQDEMDLHEKIKANNLFLISAKAKEEKQNSKRLKSNMISEFSRNVGELLGAGVTLVKALRIISEDESIKPKEREIYAAILKLVRSGMAFSDAISAQGDAFPPLFINMIKSAESSGNMDQIALQMAEYYNKEYKLTQKIKSSMTYPKILCVLIVVVVAIIMGYVIPQFQSLFSQMDTLPKSTTALLNISNFVKKKWYLIILFAIIAYVVFKLLFSIPSVRYGKDKLELKLPVIGKLRKVIYTARFARTMSSLYSAGISIINCLQIAKNTIGNRYIEKQFEQVIAEVRAGEMLSVSLDRVDGFTKKLSSSVMVGEETGALDSMLVSIANQMEYDSEMALNKLVSYLEPAMIVVMAVIVGFIIISVIQPIYGSYQSMSTSYQ
ncbi:MAG: type II secretion system F family protein [Eubacteriales bacterium]|nr:type II secretion system F family protein [Lachnospiraceae bacterium]MDO5127086.1 type II secretion system F family protein [Eubacteriales bacterium]